MQLVGRDPSGSGLVGICPLFRLPYVSPPDLPVFSIGHSALLGVLCRFMAAVLPPKGRKKGVHRLAAEDHSDDPTEGSRQDTCLPQDYAVNHYYTRLIAERCSGFTLPPAFGRPVRDIIHQRGMYFMEDWKRLLWLLPALFRQAHGHPPPLHPLVKRALGHLRRFLVFHLTSQSGSRDHLLLELQDATKELLQFATLAEEVTTGCDGIISANCVLAGGQVIFIVTYYNQLGPENSALTLNIIILMGWA